MPRPSTTPTLVLATASLLAPAAASATVLSGIADLSFESPAAGDGAAYRGVGGTTFRSGQALPGERRNRLRVTADAFEAPVDTLFRLASFEYRNGVTYVGTDVDAVNLRAAVDLGRDIGGRSFEFELDLRVTPNTFGDPVLDADTLYLAPITAAATTFDIEGRRVTLHLRGFSGDGGRTLRDTFTLPENETVGTGLYASFSDPVAPSTVPEPSSLALLAAGAALLLKR